MGFEVSSWHANAMEFVFTRSKLAAREEARIQNLIQKQIPSTRASPLWLTPCALSALQFAIFSLRFSHFAFGISLLFLFLFTLFHQLLLLLQLGGGPSVRPARLEIIHNQFPLREL